MLGYHFYFGAFMPRDPGNHVTTTALFGARLANELAGQEERRRAGLVSRIDSLDAELRDSRGEPAIYIELAECHAKLGDHDAALDTLRSGVGVHPLAPDLHYALIRRLHKYGLDEEALAAGDCACKLVPGDFSLALEHYLYLP